MNTESLRIFCDVVHLQSFSRGAEANDVSQSAATQAIRRLENQLGAQLLDRAKRPFTLTPEGKICYEGFREILETYDSVLSRLESSRSQDGGMIRVAAIYSVGLHEMSKCMREFMKERPKSKIRLEFLHPNKVYQAVLNAEADFGVVSYPAPTNEINVVPLRSEEMVVVVPVGSELAKAKSVRLEQLQGASYVAFDRDLPIRRETDRHMRQHNVRVDVVTEFDNIETIKQAIEVGLGVSILPEPTVAEEVAAKKLVAIPLVSPKITRPIGVVYRRRKTFSPAAARFVQMLGGTIPPANTQEVGAKGAFTTEQND